MTDDRMAGQPERRRDRRLSIKGRVHIAPRRSDGSVAADLVDVSASGLCAVASAPLALTPGSAVDVEIRMPKVGRAQRDVDFRGGAVVLRIDGVGGKSHTALRFVQPLQVREPFTHLAMRCSDAPSTT